MTYPLSRTFRLNPLNGPLWVRSLMGHAAYEGWDKPRMVQSDAFDRELGAMSALTDAFAIVDDVVHVECPEPVLTLFHVRDRRSRLMVELLPWATASLDHFRVDRHREALGWARSRRVRLLPADITPPVQILHRRALTRLDGMEIARDAARNWPRTAEGFIGTNEGEDRQRELHRTLTALAGEGPVSDPALADRAMEALDRLFLTSGRAFSPYLGRLLERWRAERPADLFSLPDAAADDLTPDDLAALADLSSSLQLPPA